MMIICLIIKVRNRVQGKRLPQILHLLKILIVFKIKTIVTLIKFATTNKYQQEFKRLVIKIVLITMKSKLIIFF